MGKGEWNPLAAKGRRTWYERDLVTVARDRQDVEAKRASDDDSPAASEPPHRALGLADGLLGLRQLMDRLLAPDGCPWDREQTLDSLRPYLLEEAHEVLEAMDDPVAHRAELGDLLFQIVFQSALREREGAFDLEDVIAGIRDKMIRRHPHVFARERSSDPRTPDDVARQWEAIKRAERAETGAAEVASPLLGVPSRLPSLVRAWRLQEKAASVGFDWPDIAGALEKWAEEWQEFEDARRHGDLGAMRDEFGDLLFVLVRIGQKLGLDADDALRRANAKFERRFSHVMQCCHSAGLDPAEAGLAQLEAFWQDAKRLERSASDPNSG